MRRLPAVLSQPRVRRLLSAVTLSAVGRWIYNVGLAAYVFDDTHSAGWLAAVSVGRYLPSLFISPLVAMASDGMRPQHTIAVCDAVAAVCVTVIAVGAGQHIPIVVIVVLAAVTSSATRARVPVTAAVLVGLVPEREIAAANAALRSTESLALVVGSVTGAVLVALGHPPLALAVTAGCFAVCLGLTATRRSGQARMARTPGPRVAARLNNAARTIAAIPAARNFLALGASASLLFGADTVLLVVIAHDRLRDGSAGYGLLLAGLGLGGLLGATAVDRLCRTRRTGLVAAAALALYALPTLLFLSVHTTAVGIPIEVLRGAGSLVAEAVALTALQRSVRALALPEILAVFHGILLAALVLGAAITPVLLHGLGLRDTLIAAGCVIPAAVLLALPRLAWLDRAGQAWAERLAPRVAVLRELGIFEGARQPTLERLAARLTEQERGPGEVLVTEGEPADALYVVVTGSLEVHAATPDGTVALIRRLDAPTYIGEIGLLRRMPRTATVTTTTAALVYRIEGEEFLAALSDGPVDGVLAEGLSARLARTHPALVDAPAGGQFPAV